MTLQVLLGITVQVRVGMTVLLGIKVQVLLGKALGIRFLRALLRGDAMRMIKHGSLRRAHAKVHCEDGGIRTGLADAVTFPFARARRSGCI